MEQIDLFNCSESRAFGKVSKFWELYGGRFPSYYQKYFAANIFEMIENNNVDTIDEITKSIFNYLGLLSFEADKESQFLSFFEQLFGAGNLYKKGMVCVTQNFVPTLSNKIADEIYRGHHGGYVRLYGPNLVVKDSPRIIERRKVFSSDDLTDEDEMIISFAPRENSEQVVKAAINKEKELLLNFDGYVPEKSPFRTPTEDEYIKELYDYASRFRTSDFDVDVVKYASGQDQALILKRK